MKKICSVLMLFILIISLSSCATIKKELDLSQKIDNVQSIEIYNADHAYYEGDIDVFRDENEPLAVLESEVFPVFVDELTALEFEEEVVFFPIPMDGGCDYDGYIIAVVYSDGGYDIIAREGLYSYSVGEDGKGKHKYDHSDYCGEMFWVDFVNKYIEK